MRVSRSLLGQHMLRTAHRPATAEPAAVDTCTLTAPQCPYQNLVDSMVRGEVPDSFRDSLVDAARAYDLKHLEALKNDGMTFVLSDDLPETQGGYYNVSFTFGHRRPPTLAISSKARPENLRGYIIHELFHAVDSLKFSKARIMPARMLTLTTGDYASQHDPELAELYKGYLGRVERETAKNLEQALFNDGSRPRDGQYGFEVETLLGPTRSSYLPAQASGVNQPIMVMEGESNWSKPSLRPLLVKAGVVAGVSLAAGALTHPAVGVACAGLGALLLHNSAYNTLSQRRREPFHDYAAEGVLRKNGQTLVRLNGEEPKEVLFSAYAFRTRDIREYAAEGARYYLDSPETRQLLKSTDPGLYAWLEAQQLEP